jgi:hypothetical protein
VSFIWSYWLLCHCWQDHHGLDDCHSLWQQNVRYCDSLRFHIVQYKDISGVAFTRGTTGPCQPLSLTLLIPKKPQQQWYCDDKGDVTCGSKVRSWERVNRHTNGAQPSASRIAASRGWGRKGPGDVHCQLPLPHISYPVQNDRSKGKSFVTRHGSKGLLLLESTLRVQKYFLPPEISYIIFFCSCNCWSMHPWTMDTKLWAFCSEFIIRSWCQWI